MKIFRVVERFELFNNLVKSESTGTPDQFAGRLGISRSTLYDFISELNSMGVEISYSRSKSSFYYSSCKCVNIEINIKIEKI